MRTVGRNRLLRANTSHPAAQALTQLLEVSFGPKVVVAEEFAILGAVQVLIFGHGPPGTPAKSARRRMTSTCSWSARSTVPISTTRPTARTPVSVLRSIPSSVGRSSGTTRLMPWSHRSGRWKRGESEVPALIASGELQKLTGDAANGERSLEKAVVTLETARSAIDRDPHSAFVLAYDASRHALTALLAHQGVRPTTRGGHYAVEQAVRAPSSPYGLLGHRS